jgi:hypothetical protein
VRGSPSRYGKNYFESARVYFKTLREDVFLNSTTVTY